MWTYDEPESDEAEALLRSDPSLLTARRAIVEVRRSLARPLEERGAAARRAGGSAVPFLTYDVRQAQAARGIGLTVVGA